MERRRRRLIYRSISVIYLYSSNYYPSKTYRRYYYGRETAGRERERESCNNQPILFTVLPSWSTRQETRVYKTSPPYYPISEFLYRSACVCAPSLRFRPPPPSFYFDGQSRSRERESLVQDDDYHFDCLRS